MNKYFALNLTSNPRIHPLEGANNFDEADEIAEKMMKQGEVIPWVLCDEDLKSLQDDIQKCLTK